MGKLMNFKKRKEATAALKATQQEKHEPASTPYSSFEHLNGWHPWQDAVPEGYILYPVRRLAKGSVAYFNYNLAKEMGLIPKDHPSKMNPELNEKILDTFCLRIVNEYDQKNNIKYPPSTIKPNEYMATRYLQLQHSNKRGETSGDGRCIWNGFTTHKGITWDVSSRGTGVTVLSPGAVEAGRPLKSGNTDFGYGCGLAEIDELYAGAILAEIFHLNGINTERVLAVIDLGDGVGIGVRAAKNLFRPAHLFMFLKQENYEALKRAADFLIDRQVKNKEWQITTQGPRKYDLMLHELCESFACFTAQMDREYIFAWLDWDGDNVLSTAGIIDYGSVRQFGLRHDQYRYDDVDRYSTNLNEQKNKAKLIIQVFAQLTDYLKTRTKKPIAEFKNHPEVEKFDKHYDYYGLDHLLYRVGFTRKQREHLLEKHTKDVESFFDNYSYLERVKTVKKEVKVADGINRPAIFNLRSVVRQLPALYLEQPGSAETWLIDVEDLFSIMLSENASKADSRLTEALQKRLLTFQDQYKKLVKNACTSQSARSTLKKLSERAAILNRADRITGNALLNIVNEILEKREEGLSHAQIQKVIDSFIMTQCLRPELNDPVEAPKLHGSRRSRELMDTMLKLVEGYKEDI